MHFSDSHTPLSQAQHKPVSSSERTATGPVGTGRGQPCRVQSETVPLGADSGRCRIGHQIPAQKMPFGDPWMPSGSSLGSGPEMTPKSGRRQAASSLRPGLGSLGSQGAKWALRSPGSLQVP